MSGPLVVNQRSARGDRLRALVPRVTVYVAVAILSLAGARAILRGGEPEVVVSRQTAPGDLGARALAEGFARAWLAYDAARPQERYIERLREPQTGAMVIGKAVGATIAAYFAARMAGEPLAEADADDLLEAEFDESAGRRDTGFGQEESETLREQSREALRAYRTELAPSVRPRAVERRFELCFESARWSIVGYLDVEDESGDTIDVKVGAKLVTEGRAATDPQPTLYRLARRAEGHEGGRFLFHSVRRGAIRSGERCLIVPAERTLVQLDAMDARIAHPPARSSAAPRQTTGRSPRQMGGGVRPGRVPRLRPVRAALARPTPS